MDADVVDEETERSDPAKTDTAEGSPAGQDLREFFSRTRSFIRRGERMGPSLQRTWDNHRDEYLVKVARGSGHTTVDLDARVEPAEIFAQPAPLVVEVGCGTGTQIVHAASTHPQTNFLGFEVWIPGLAKTVSGAVQAGGLPNLRLLDFDAQQAAPVLLPAGCVDEVWTFFPDPWPKARHKKRRLVSPGFATKVVRLLKPGGLWRLATDWDDYAYQIRDVIESTPGLANLHVEQRPEEDDPAGGTHGGFAPRWEGRTLTVFERRALRDGRIVHDVTAQKIPEGEPLDNAVLGQGVAEMHESADLDGLS
ncbi:MAG: tRNA (guanosine(46)-N7)-methyltransferase TrmB [Actinomycetaceae bacterium]|nr:tRNA (guanosine(46)-N7)-methyltransferase TrmB [Actinomycetaceae bacterium]